MERDLRPRWSEVPTVSKELAYVNISANVMQPFGRSRVRERLLMQFFNHPGLAVHVRELARRVGASPPAVSKELIALERSGVLTSHRVGRSLEYRINDGPVTDAVRTLFQRTVGVEALLREAVVDLPGVEAAFIHGSYAGGQERSGSDVDVIVVGDPDRIELAERLAGVERQIGRPVSMLLVQRSQLSARLAKPDGFWRSVIDSPRIQLVGSKLEDLIGGS
jgi:predicted nucleotidyltransferase